MICLNPIPVVISATSNPRKKAIRFNPRFFFDKDGNIIPHKEFISCGKCINCRLHYCHEWGIRCHHETASSPCNYFVTLTYSPDHLPLNGSLQREDLTLFMKRLRKHFSGSKKSTIRYFGCGEYGSANKRPHYHLLLFNTPISDLVYDRTIKGVKYSRSLTLESVWKKGHVLVGPVNYESAAYVAGYALKKQKGSKRTFYYKNLSTGLISSFKTDNKILSTLLADYQPKLHVLRKGKILADLSKAYDIKTGEAIFPDLFDDKGKLQYNPLKCDICILDDEFSVMSRMPGIGHAFYEKNKKEMFKNGFIIFKGRKYSIPKYYCRKYYETCSDEEYEAAQAARQNFIDSLNLPDFNPDLLQKKLASVEKRVKLFSNRYL